MNTKIKNNLFSFTTLRNPEKLEEEKKVQFFIYMPDDGDSPAVSLLRTNDTEEFEDNLNNFEPLTYLQLKNNTPNFYKWSFYIYHNRQSINSNRFIDKYTQYVIGSESSITLENKLKWWDNFIYQLDIHKRPNFNISFEKEENADAREAVMILIYGYYWLEKFTVNTPSEGEPFLSLTGESVPIEEKIFKRILQARIVEPAFIKTLSDQPIGNTRMAQFSGFDSLSIAAKNEYTNIWLGYKAKETLNNLFILERELKTAYRSYLKLENAQKKEYDTEYEQLYNTYLQDLETDPETQPPLYDYSSLEELDETRLSNHLSERSTFVYNSIKQVDTDSFQEMFGLLDYEIKQNESTQATLKKNIEKLIEFKGIVFSNKSNRNIPDMSFALGGIQIEENVWTWKLLVKVNKATENIHQVNYSISENSLISSKSASSYFRHGYDIYVISLFESGLDLTEYTGQLTVEATLLTDNQQSFQINAEISLDSLVFGLLEAENEIGGVALRTAGGNVTAPEHDRQSGITRLGIAEYKVVEQSVCCYVAGEVAHIENVMANEFKEKTTKTTQSQEVNIVSETSSEKENSTDVSTSSRNEMQQEVAKILQQSKDFNFNTTFSGGFGKVYNYSLNSGFAMNNSKEQSNNLAITKSKEITEKAVEKILSKTRQEKSIRTVEEYSEESKHGFDNRENPNHISGVYRWIDKIYKNEIFNYGKRLMYEFMIPEPARFHHLWANSNNPKDFNVLEKPKDPRDEIADFGALTESNYIKWASMYNANVDVPPEFKKVIGASYSTDFKEKKGTDYAYNDLVIPEGYRCIKLFCQFDYRRQDQTSSNATVIVGNHHERILRRIGNGAEGLDALKKDWIINLSDDNKYTDNTIPVSIVLWDVSGFSLNITAYLERKSETFENWKKEAFNLIMEAYYQKLSEFDQLMKEINLSTQEKKKTNPAFYREIEQILIRKNCIAYLLGHDNMGMEFYDGETLTSLIINRTGLYQYAEIVKFLEQAFEWEIMSYIFYPFYWGSKSRWEELYSQSSIYYDDTFVKFMESGMARVIVTVRSGFEDAVNWFLETGEIWNGTTPPVVGDELYLSIVEELQEPEYYVDGSWETRVPTNFMLIQNGTVGLNADGLPCECTKVYDENGNLVSGSPDIIYQENPEGVGFWIVNPDPAE